MNMNQQCTLIFKKVNHALEFLRVNVARGFELSYSPLLGTGEGTHGVLCLGLSPCFENDIEKLEEGPLEGYYNDLGYTCPMS